MLRKRMKRGMRLTMMKSLKTKSRWWLLRLYSWYKAQQLDRNVFAWNQMADLAVVIGVLFVVVQNNATLGTLFTTIIQAVQTQLQKLITQNQL